MNLHTQLLLGYTGIILGFVFLILLILTSLPLLIWLIISIVRWVKWKKGKAFQWWSITIAILCGLGVVLHVYSKLFCGAPYMIANQIKIHVPMSVQVLENDSDIAIDGSGSYTVVRFNDTQMRSFISLAKKRGWKQASVIPYSLLQAPDGLDLMSGKANPLPRTQHIGYYEASFQHNMEKYAGVGGYVIRNVYFADIKSKILYVYSYQGQGP